MKLVLWPSGAGGDFLLGLSMLMSNKTDKFKYNRKTFQFEAPFEFCVRYEFALDEFLHMKDDPDSPGLDETVNFITHHNNDEIDYNEMPDFENIIHIRSTDWRTLSYINCLYYTKVITYDRITGDNGPPEDQHFDYRLGYWENTQIDGENVVEINYEKLFFDGDEDEAKKLFDVLGVEIEDTKRFLKLCKLYTECNFHHLVERPYLDEETTRYEGWEILQSENGPNGTLNLLEEILQDSYHRISLDIREQWKLEEDWDGDEETHK